MGNQPGMKEKLGYTAAALGQSLAGGDGIGMVMREQENRRRLEQAGADRVLQNYQRQQQMGREDTRYADMIARQDRTDAQQNANRVEDNMRRSLADIDQDQYRANTAAEDTRRFELGRADRLAELAQKQTGGADGLSRPGALQAMTNRTLADIGTNQIKGDLALSRFAAGPEGIAKPTTRSSGSSATEPDYTDDEWLAAMDLLEKKYPGQAPSKDSIKAQILRNRRGTPTGPTATLGDPNAQFFPALRGLQPPRGN